MISQFQELGKIIVKELFVIFQYCFANLHFCMRVSLEKKIKN